MNKVWTRYNLQDTIAERILAIVYGQCGQVAQSARICGVISSCP
jgi:hypothetical protein